MTKLLTSIFLLIALITNAQSVYKKSSDLKKRNKIKQTDRYLLDKSKSINPMLFGSYVYDRNGRIIDSKKFLPNGKFSSHSQFEYPNDTIRIKILFDSTGVEIKKIEQKVDLSEKEIEREKVDDKNFEYVYDSNGNIAKIYKIKDNKKSLLMENKYNDNNYLIQESFFEFKLDGTKIPQVIIYTRDESDNILRITRMSENEIEYIEFYTHKKYST
ncbi:hypothetical protein ACFPH8_14635 [Bizionia hallyeonensis]|uniref:YD repeat-containing protein n=1 Tax=Bizionia hallyeonensis TaxID=1123757 RepID=A0ABW0CA46_9FLAO